MKKRGQNVKWYCLKAVGLNLSCCKLKRCHLIQRNYTSLLQHRIRLENFKCDRSHIIFRKFLIFCWEGKKEWVRFNHHLGETMAGCLQQPHFCCLVRRSEPTCKRDSFLCFLVEITASQTRLLRLTCTLHKDNRWKFWFRATAKK